MVATNANERLLEICREHIAHWQKVIELMEAGRIGAHAKRDGHIVDITYEEIAERRRMIAELEDVVGRIEAANA